MTDPWFVSGFEEFYLELYAHRSEAEATVALGLLELAGVGVAGKLVLDLACGAGRHTQALADSGAFPAGLDLSPALLADARARLGPEAWLARGDMRRLPFADAAFAGALSMFTSFGYFPGDEENWSVAAEMRRVIRPGGFLLFDFLNAETVLAGLVPVSERRGVRYLAHERRRIEGKRVLKSVRVLALDGGAELTRYEESVRLYTRGELRHGFRALGFAELRCFGDYEGGEFAPGSSPRLILLMERGAA